MSEVTEQENEITLTTILSRIGPRKWYQWALLFSALCVSLFAFYWYKVMPPEYCNTSVCFIDETPYHVFKEFFHEDCEQACLVNNGVYQPLPNGTTEVYIYAGQIYYNKSRLFIDKANNMGVIGLNISGNISIEEVLE